jgi:hypothetical protein
MERPEEKRVRLEYRVHRPTGDVWAVETDAEGTVIRCAGPIARDQTVREVLARLRLDTRDVDWVKENWGDFVRDGFA